MQGGGYDRRLLEDQTITNYVVKGIILGYEFKIRYPSWRGTYLSCIEKLEFRLDREVIDRGAVIFSLNNKQYLPGDWDGLYKEYWYVLDYGTVTVLKRGGIPKGIHEITVDMFHRVPYGKGEDRYRVIESVVTKALMAE